MIAKVWANIDDSIVDLKVLENGLKEKGIQLIKEHIARGDKEKQVFLANGKDAVVSTMELWDQTIVQAIENPPKLLMRYGAGTNNINIPDMTAAGIAVANIPGQNSAAVAEIALLHILNCGRHFSDSLAKTQGGIWPSNITGQELDGKTVGLVGFGNIPQNLTRLLLGFRVEIMAYDKYFDYLTNADKYPRVTFVHSLEDIFKQSDVISVHLPSTDETRGSINRNLFKKMKHGALFINTSRGDIVKEDDLLWALDEELIAYAGLDVLGEEPPQPNNPLLTHPNVYVTGHMGAGSMEAEIRSQKVMVQTIADFLQEKMSDNILNKNDL